MNVKTTTTWSILACAAWAATTSSAWAQGGLTPPGAPATTMKTLAQVEPRTPISSAPVTLSQPGSYYLTTNVNGTITIDADYVTLDLMGFRVAPTAGDAIDIPTGKGKHTVVRNGTLRLNGASAGVDARYVQDGNSRFEDLIIDGNDVAWCGIYAGSGCLIRDCDIRNCNNNGILGNSTHGGLEVRECRVIGGTVDGITVYQNSRLIGNVIEGNGDDGLVLISTNTHVKGNIVRGNRDNYELAAGNLLDLLLCQVPETLDQPCSAKLAGNLASTAGGVVITASGVTLDLMGFTLSGRRDSSDHGVHLDGEAAAPLRNIVVRNGVVSGFGYGILIQHVQDSRFEHLVIATNLSFGVYFNARGAGNRIVHCTISRNGSDGIIIYGFNGPCYGNTIANCTIDHNEESGVGLSSYTSQCNGNTIADCTIIDNGDYGISLDGNGGQCDGNSIVNCLIRGNVDQGIHLGYATGNRIEGNHISGQTGASGGIYCLNTTNNLIFRNTCVGQTYNYHMSASDVYGPIVTNTGALATSGAAAHPWANFSR